MTGCVTGCDELASGQVLAGVPASRRCPGHTSDPAASGSGSGWLRRLLGRS